MRGDGEKTAVLLDRHPLWLEALARLLETVGVEVIGTTTSPRDALDLIEQERPSLFIAEYELIARSPEGLASLRRATSANPSVHALVLSTENDPAQIEAAFNAGATMYCVKTAEPEDLASAIRQAFESSIHYAGARDSLREIAPAEPVDLSGLTKREVEILQLVAEGHSNSQLAKMLWVTEQTVKFHLSNIYRKLDVSNRTEASRWAQLHGLLPAAPGQATAVR
jgi:two-component system, NarL family, response regulator DevR